MNPKQILWTDTNSAPPSNYLWQKEDGIYTFVNGNWKRTKVFRKLGPYCDDEDVTLIAKLTEGEYANIEDVPLCYKTNELQKGWTRPAEDLETMSFEKSYSDNGTFIYYNAYYINPHK